MIICVVNHSADRDEYRIVDSCYRNDMSPTVFREKGYRFYFLSNEEDRIHIHVTCEDGEAKFWLEPVLLLAVYHGLNPKRLNGIKKIVEEHRNEIIEAWQRHFGKR
jgi:hypothetical protein